ncbi:MAG: 2OG-Fe(II) oxygenase [Alphaproteobacteria bacterium]
MNIPPHVLAELERAAQGGDSQAQYVLFALLGRAGRKAEARAWLAKSAAAGNPDALYSKACLLLDGIDGPRDVRQAFEMLRDTADTGGTAAMRPLAVLVALGVEGEADRARAVALVNRAAELGDTGAAQQAALIASGVFEVPLPSREVLSRSPDAWRLPGLFAPEVCRYLIEAAEGFLHPSFVIDPRTGQTLRSDVRTSSTATIHPFQQDLVMHFINERLCAAAGLKLSQGEMLGVLKYEIGQQYRPHFDFLDPSAGATSQFATAGQRIATLLVALNDDYTGGETTFLSNGLSWRGRVGEGLLFWNVDASGRPDMSTKHAGNPVTRGQKFIISKWFREKPVAY